MKKSFFDRPFVSAAMSVAGTFMMVAAYQLFFVPNKIAPGGFSGLATVLHHQFGFPVGMTTLALNIPLFLFALKDQGRAFIIRSLTATIGFSVLLDFFPVYQATDDMLLSSVYGGGFVGIGLGLVVRAGCSTGGSDMLAKLLSDRVVKASFGAVLFIIETVIIGVSGIVFGPQSALYAVLSLLISSRLIDALQEGFNAAKAFFIITWKGAQVGKRIIEELDSGATALRGTGMYSGEGRDVLLCVIHRWEMSRLKHLVQETDPGAFMIVTDVREALGEGFIEFPKAIKTDEK